VVVADTILVAVVLAALEPLQDLQLHQARLLQ
jgi:hypothetical protein